MRPGDALVVFDISGLPVALVLPERDIGRLNDRCDRIEVALAASGRPVPAQATKTTLSDFTGGYTNDP